MFLEHEQLIAELEDQLGSLLARGKCIEAQRVEQRLVQLKKEVLSVLTPLQRLQICRHLLRPRPADLLHLIGTDCEELHGDRLYGDDAALKACLLTIDGHRCVVLASDKGKTTQERIDRRFGMVNPEGFRKAQRVMRLAERFRLPVVSLIDTAGAFAGLEAEERGQGWAIAETIALMGILRTPVISVIMGEGCSGGALALAVSDWLALFEHAYFSVISPEGCSSILWRDRTAVAQAAQALQIQAEDLLGFGLIDAILPEGPGGSHLHPGLMAQTLRTALSTQIARLQTVPLDSLLQRRQARYRTLQISPYD